ncbi:MAG: hypothetical protein ACOCYP_00055 [Planctomycetota bacterium]
MAERCVSAGALRLILTHFVQLPAVLLVLWGTGPTAWWIAGLWGSVVACAGTDSGWVWRNRLLVSEAVCWLALPLCLMP